MYLKRLIIIRVLVIEVATNTVAVNASFLYPITLMIPYGLLKTKIQVINKIWLDTYKSPNCGRRTISSTTAWGDSNVAAYTIFAMSSASIILDSLTPLPLQLSV